MKFSRTAQLGLSLVELMVSITLAAIITAAVLAMFINANRSYNEDERYSRMMENGRFALNTIAKDLMMVDFWGEMVTPPGGMTLTAGNDCNIDADDPESALYYYEYDNDCNAVLAAGANSIPANSNVLVLKGVHGEPEPSGFEHPFKANADLAYLRTNRTEGTIMDGSGTPDTDEVDWAYLVRLYYILEDDASGVPYLCRNVAERNGTQLDFVTIDSTDDCLAEGIEYLHVEFGLDTTGDGIANRYVSSNLDAATLEGAVSARVYLLARSARSSLGYTNDRRFVLGDETLGPFNDGFYRRVFSTTVLLRNPKSLIILR